VATLLSFMGISGFFGLRNIRGLSVGIEPPAEVFAGADMPIRIVIRNEKRRAASFLIRVRAGGAELLFPVVGPGLSASGLIGMNFGDRGRYRISDVHVSSVYPFNFFTRYRRLDFEADLVVFPAPKKCPLSAIFSDRKTAAGDISSDRAGFESDLLSIRDYHSGDPMKYIHWKASAKTRKLKTKELSSLSHRPLIIDFDNLKTGTLEERLSYVTYHILRSHRMNVPMGLKIGGKLFSPPTGVTGGNESSGGRAAMLRELALYEKG
jgi:uncharacterized protein (DUF58 family)